MKTYSVVMLDIDGTLVDSNMQISVNTTKLLDRLQKRGIPVVLCSGRDPRGVELVEQQAGLNSPIVCYSGGLILDTDRSILKDTGIVTDDAIRFKQFTAKEFPDISTSTYMYEIWLADTIADPNIQLLMARNQCEPVVGDLKAALQGVPHVHKLLCAGTPKKIQQLQDIAAQKFPDLEFARSGSIFLEVLPKTSSKLTAMELICDHYHVDAEQVVAIGDYYVDIEMIQHAGLGIAMGNAPDAVKQAAVRVTASNDEEGVYIALKTLKYTAPDVDQ